MTRVRGRLEECGRRHGFPVVDLTPPLRAESGAFRSPYLTFDPHWNALGHQVAAKALATDLRARGWLPACAGR